MRDACTWPFPRCHLIFRCPSEPETSRLHFSENKRQFPHVCQERSWPCLQGTAVLASVPATAGQAGSWSPAAAASPWERETRCGQGVRVAPEGRGPFVGSCAHCGAETHTHLSCFGIRVPEDSEEGCALPLKRSPCSGKLYAWGQSVPRGGRSHVDQVWRRPTGQNPGSPGHTRGGQPTEAWEGKVQKQPVPGSSVSHPDGHFME